MTLRKLLKAKWSIFLLFIVWAGIVYVNYFRHYHVPFKRGRLYWQEFLLLSVILLLTFALGRKILKLLKVRIDSFLEESIFSIGLGLGGLSYIILALGFLGLLYTWAANLLILVLALLLVPEIKEILLKIKGKIQDLSKIQASAWSIFLSSIIAIAILLNLIGALVPPIFFDALTYHLAVPFNYIQHHRIVPIPYNFYSNFPLTIEMIYGVAMLLQSDILAKLINFSMGILIMFAVYTFSRKYFTNNRIALLAATIFYTIPMVGTMSSTAYIDLGFTLFNILAIFTLIHWFSNNKKRWLILSGIFCGLSLGTKYTGAFTFIILIMGIVIKSLIDKKRLLLIIKSILAFSAISIAIFLPWAIKNFAFTGNPVYPALYNIFGGRNWDINCNQRLLTEVRRPGMGYQLRNYLVLPWNLTMYDQHFAPGGPFGILGPLFLAFLPLLLFFRNIGRPLKYLILFSISYFILWAFSTQVTRHLLPIFPLLSVMVAYILLQLVGTRKVYTKVIIVLFLVTTLLTNLFHTFAVKHCFQDPIPVVFGGESKENYLRRAVRNSPYGVIFYVNRYLSGIPTTKILFIGETRTHYCQPRYIASTALSLTPIIELTRLSNSPRDLLSQFKKQKITHVLYNYKEAKTLGKEPYNYFYWTKDEEERFKDFQEKYLELIYTENQVCLYQVKYEM